ncbi:tyrosine-type recombinase/integrase [Sphingomonas sp. 10B4]|uniref:tyrosine-type recombinase/integrase n=1 Tax=Sphingomonas sp. 10B4 TaxID=3048575 RepID=UPI002B22C56F|nr:integrase arm-type DNA-binding domain-containing protein [Sphingomonas sp. 10B4]MEB0281659.1 integrase arm-type DNA-binding domain-containing protein [Sphingomonas sp. 10B4]
MSNALTALQVKNAKAGRHADGGGLHLLVKDTGARSWVFRFMLKGRSRDIGLGAAGPDGISLSAARDLAAALRLKVKAGIDPLEERQREAAQALADAQAAQVAGVTFKAVAEAYIGANEASWRNAKHRQQWSNTLASYVYPIVGDMRVSSIDTAHILQIIEPMWKATPETASRVRGRIETVLDAAKARGYREGENPARWRGHLAQLLPARPRLSRGHHKALPYETVPAFVADLRERKAFAALALEFAILTATRTNEVLGATWAEVDMDKATWTIPADRMKAAREHRIPLSPRALEILESVKAAGKGHLFPATEGGKMSNMAMAMLLRRMEVDCTVHGFRSAFRDWAAESTGYAHEVCEMALAHVIGNKAEAAYRRGDLFDKRRRMMADWAAFCARGDAAGATVTPMRRAHVA